MRGKDTVDFMKARKELDHLAEQVLISKGPDYAGALGSRYNDFIFIRELLRNFSIKLDSPAGAWAVYFLKHVFAVLAWLGQERGSETLTSRIIDGRNYLDLLYGMSREGLLEDE